MDTTPEFKAKETMTATDCDNEDGTNLGANLIAGAVQFIEARPSEQSSSPQPSTRPNNASTTATNSSSSSDDELEELPDQRHSESHSDHSEENESETPDQDHSEHSEEDVSEAPDQDHSEHSEENVSEASDQDQSEHSEEDVSEAPYHGHSDSHSEHSVEYETMAGVSYSEEKRSKEEERSYSPFSTESEIEQSVDNRSIDDISTVTFYPPSPRDQSEDEELLETQYDNQNVTSPSISSQTTSENDSSDDDSSSTSGEGTSGFILESFTDNDSSASCASILLKKLLKKVDVDDEKTISKEEALIPTHYLNSVEELMLLKTQATMPIEELLRLYKYQSNVNSNHQNSEFQPEHDCNSQSNNQVSEKSDSEPITENSSKPEDEVLSPLSTNDTTFEPSVDMMVHDFDDEETLAEEEALAAKEQNDVEEEMSALEKEGTMSLEELRVLYNIPPSEQNTPEDNEDVQSSVDTAETGPVEADESAELYQLYNDLCKTEETGNGEDDKDYNPTCSENLQHVMIGPEYQANVAEGLELYDMYISPYENEDILLWNPQPISEQSTEKYLTQASFASNVHLVKGIRSCPQRMRISDDEEKLNILQKCEHSPNLALRRLKYDLEPDFAKMADWSENECRLFEAGFLEYGKDFYKIQINFVTTRSVKDVVLFYYMWKKQTNRPEIFMRQAEEKKKLKAVQAIATKKWLDTVTSPVASTSAAAGEAGGSLPVRRYSTRIFNFQRQKASQNPESIQDIGNSTGDESDEPPRNIKRRRCEPTTSKAKYNKRNATTDDDDG